MKKILLASLLAATFLTIAQQCTAQSKDTLTAKTAVKKHGYTVLNAGEAIVIYKYVHASHSPKEAEKYAPRYFFTTANSDVLQPLTKDNLKAAFPANHKFHDALDAACKDDKDLYEYDSFHKTYKVNHVLLMNGN